QLSNTSGGTLTITSVTNLSATEFKSNINPGISLVAGQVHEFGFSYEPLNYGADNQSFVITTNGGTLTITLTGGALSSVFSDSFESYSDFVVSFPPWTTYNGDAGTPGGISGVTYPNSTTQQDWIIFNPATTTPAVNGAAPHIGAKYAMAMYNNSAVPNNDWMITPALNLAGSPSLSFWAMSYSTYLETFKVYYSTTNNTAPGSFTLLATQASVPSAWTQYTYNLPAACANQPNVYIAIVHASTDQFMLLIDDVLVSDNSSPGTPYFGNINGYVYRSGTTTPVIGAKVTSGTKLTYSDANGFYQFNNMLVGTHSVSASASGQFYFPASASGVVVTNGNTTSQDIFLTWAEIAVNPTALTSNLYLGEAEDQNFAISNPGGTANLEYELWLTTSTRGNNPRLGNQMTKRPPLSSDAQRIENLPIQHASDRAEGWMGYTNFDDADTYMTAATTNREKATRFTLENFGLWSNGVTISKLRALFYNPSDAAWGTATNFYFKIYGASGTGTALFTSPTYTAVSLVDMECVLPTPLVMTTDFWVSVYCVTNGGKPNLLGSTASSGNSYNGASSAAWTAVAGMDWCIDAYAVGDEWIRAGSYAGTVAPAATVNTNMHFSTTNLAVGTKNAYMYIFNNANYNSPSTQRGDYMVIPVQMNVTAPPALGNISGVVYKAGTSTPIQGATVSIVGRTYVTLANGAYSFTNVSAVLHTLTVTALGYADYSADVTIPEGVTLTHDVNMNFAEAYTATTSFSTDLVVGGSTVINVPLNNTGNVNLEYETASGVWGGTSFPTTALNQTFEAGDMTGWAGLEGPNTAIYTGYGYTGTHTFVFNALGTTSPQYIITPKLRVATGDNLAFWYQEYNDTNETFNVMISTTDNNIASFTNFATIGPLVTADSRIWANYSASLNAYAGQDIYVCFYYPRTDAYEFAYIMIDDITGPMAVVPPSDWLSCTPVGFPVNEVIVPGDSQQLSLAVNAATLPVGTYTAQTWIFSNAVVSPYKLYVTLNVTAPVIVTPDAPVISGIEAFPGYISIAWEETANAVQYKVFGSADPYATAYTLIGTVAAGTEYIEISDATLASHGLTTRGFFYVKADSESRSSNNKTALNVRSISSSPLLPNFKRMHNTRTLNALQ
ncbi:MAG: choice-of-anchor J domain-containing protein, partial [Candidatus Cloacimonetes bacterium]|nr:choice-of-anchor J domain-containing protein [Candidatus Cloacimonadota bacterium]